jgi:imidazolonepropionase-like amidohydrolase
MVGLALPPAEVLATVTRLGARIVGAEGELGALAPGAIADLIAVDGDPTRDLDALEHVRRVYRDGKLVARDGRVMPVRDHGATERA